MSTASLGDNQGTVGKVIRSWRTAHLSTVGASHLRTGVPCQDSSDSRSLDGGGGAFAVVADGHGSERHFRSERGSLFAVQAMVEVFDSFQRKVGQREPTPSPADRSALWQRAAKAVVANWREKVHADLIGDPPRIPDTNNGEAGLLRFIDHLRTRFGYGQVYRLLHRIHASEERTDQQETWQVKAYGTTLLAVLVDGDAIHWLQVGDGAMVKIVGGQASYLAPPPPEAIANATPSLCDDSAGDDIRCGTEQLTSGNIPSALVLVTDGLPNSYEQETGFFGFCQEVADRARTSDITADLGRWLPEISRQGSGDDMTVALAWATEVPSGSPNENDESAPPSAEVAEVDDSVPVTNNRGKERDHDAQGR